MIEAQKGNQEEAGNQRRDAASHQVSGVQRRHQPALVSQLPPAHVGEDSGHQETHHQEQTGNCR